MNSSIVKIQILLITITILNLSSVSLAQQRGCGDHNHGYIKTDQHGNKYKCDNGVWRRISFY